MTDYRLGESATRAISKVQDQGISIPAAPEYKMPRLPVDITNVVDGELMSLFGEVNSWLEFIEVQFAVSQIDEKHSESLLEELQATIQIENKTERTVSAMKARVFEDLEFLKQRDKTHKAYAYRKIMETVYNRLDRQRFIISRELSRRQGK